jgi:photosystem II stability/assembly factor-like uncharacterized protein
MTTLTPRGPESDQPEVELPSVEPENLDALIEEARRRTRRRRAGYAMALVATGLIAAGVSVSVGGGAPKTPTASRGDGAEAAKISISGQPRFDPQSVSFISPAIGWAWGPGVRWLTHGYGPGVLARTDDGGRHWRVIPSPGIDYASPSAYPFRWASGVRFVDRRRGYLFGAELYATRDGGRHWAQVRPTRQIFDLEVGAGRAYALVAGCGAVRACTQAYLYRLRNGGRTLTRIGPMSPVDPNAQLVVHGQSVFLLAPAPARLISAPIPLWVSPNGGRSWLQRVAPCRGALQPEALAAWSSAGLALACGGEPGTGFQRKTFFVSTDGGAHWRLAGQVPSPPRTGGMSGGYIASLAAADQDTWVLGEGRGTMLVTHDGGRSWRPAAFTGKQSSVEGWGYASFTDARHGVAVPWTLNGSVLAFTNNAGHAWTETPFPSPRSG